REVDALQIVRGRMIGIIASRHPFQRLADDRESAGLGTRDSASPASVVVRDRVTDFPEISLLWPPHTAADRRSRRLDMQIVRWAHRRSATLDREMHRHRRFVRTLVRGESDVAVDSHQGAADRLRIGDDVLADLAKLASEVFNEAKRRLEEPGFIAILVRLKPFAVVVTL